MMFGLYARLAVAAAIALALAASHWKAYTKGRDVVRAEWALDAAERTQAALAASEAARKVEQDLQTKVGRVDRAYQEQKRATAHVAAAAADGLRNLEAILTAPAISSSGAVASSGNHGTGGIERELLGSCAATLARMGQEADRLSLKVVTLQEYVKAIQP
jgi:Flp pilus assembly protein TadB